MSQEVKPVIHTFACPPHLRPKSSKKSPSPSSSNPGSPALGPNKSRLKFLKSPILRARSLVTPPTSPELFSLPKPKRMPEENKKLMQFCTVCASNQNRSMAAHLLLKENGFNVASFGTGSTVRLPGPAIDKPVVYQFNVPYNEMYRELSTRDTRLYTANGVLNMLDRNRRIKDHPERWQDQNQVFDVVFTCQERCFDSVCIDLLHRGAKLSRPVHVINVEIEDNHVEAAAGADAILELANMICQSPDPDTEIIEILSAWQKTHQKLPSLYQMCYF
ncbi:RNA polymerase II subunit A C-terminal domain phosphatase SSU72 [Wickerhamiella sorbophila]|uniref:RNA polymerase II subunit A C-terminal domain phosphatase SSU72 n=1 Tax=Wickerhamiella sorbophila TaxID=45607 RepID=A0A2T0FIV5_9ASCO|nr:RNA polymerase II subunit A C-terminal domain phosphatase SSU72 [Wickerhamiella sorbophila]PRT54915.1 RNA polymerase II subunit A C-terminal domain phosphatase SSU72 [Wickerhamiella sorbophila]